MTITFNEMFAFNIEILKEYICDEYYIAQDDDGGFYDVWGWESSPLHEGQELGKAVKAAMIAYDELSVFYQCLRAADTLISAQDDLIRFKR